MSSERIVESVKESYGKFAREGAERPGAAIAVGYTEEQIGVAPDAAAMTRGCGNPVALAALKAGDTVLDLGSGAGFDSFLAAARVGAAGRVIGVDMTEDMVARARENARKSGAANVEFRLGRIEALPVDDETADAVISNCVINLSVDKDKTFREAYRALKPGGKMMISDLVLLRPLPPALLGSVEAYVGCVAGAMEKADYLNAILRAGFKQVEIVGEAGFSFDEFKDDPLVAEVMNKSALSEDDIRAAFESVVSMKVSAVKN